MYSMNEQRLTDLFARYTSGESTEQEEHEFMELAAQPEYKELLENLIQELLMRAPGTSTLDEDAVHTTLQAIFRSVPAPIIAMHKKRYWRGVAAAVIFILLGTATYFFFNRSSKEPAETEIAASQDLPAPKSVHATIILSGGQRILLDSMTSGRITTQGNVSVIKLADGGIIYTGKEQPNTEILYNTLSNPRGSRVISIELADGSRVWLNAGSELRYPAAFTGRQRTVEITGEGYFEVAHNAAKPFIVQKGNTFVQVLGTHFNVNAYDDENTMAVTLLEGSVKIISGTIDVILKPGQQARIDTEQKINIENDADTGQVIAWKDGWFRFGRTDLQSIMRQLSRWYDVDVSYEGVPEQRSFSGIVSRQSNISQVLKIMQQAGIRFRMEGNKIIVTNKIEP
jgi:ferric-dicitrate binding protein FerR (iron transport regulator)